MQYQAGLITSWNQDCRRNNNNLTDADDTTLVVESAKELKSIRKHLEVKKAGLTLNIQKY